MIEVLMIYALTNELNNLLTIIKQIYMIKVLMTYALTNELNNLF